MTGRPAGLPTVLVIGAMKAATTAVHEYLDAHPAVAMTRPKELNFFNGPESAPSGDPGSWWVSGQWHRGVDWYAEQFDARCPVRGESSPAYTSPSCPEVAGRIAEVVPDVRLVYVVREPLERAVSQYAHHHREGAETRSVGAALLDPDSQYVARSRYHERLLPFLEHFPGEQVLVLVQERLLRDRDAELDRLYRHVGVDPHYRGQAHGQRFHVGSTGPAVPAPVRAEFCRRVADDVTRLRDLLHDELPEWRSA